jgi:hypothetical protein
MPTALKLNQILAIEKGVQNKFNADFTTLHHQSLKEPLIKGQIRTYAKKDDDQDDLPDEHEKVQLAVDTLTKRLASDLSRYFDVRLTKEVGNANAKADIVLEDGTTILTDVPVDYLLFLEKQLIDLRTFVAKLPTLDPAQTWSPSQEAGIWQAQPAQTTKTKKVLKVLEKAAATDKHPAQVETYHEDVLVGTWTTIKLSGAIPVSRQEELISRVEELQRAVKFARETANSIEVQNAEAGQAILGYLFA